MQDSVLMGVVNGVADLDEQMEKPLFLARRTGDLGAHVFVERDAVDVFHHAVRATVARNAAVIDADDMRVAKCGDKLDLAFESAALRCGGVSAVQ